MLGPTNGLSRHSYASGTFAAASHLMISTLEHGPPPHRSTPRAGPALPSPTLGPTNALSRYSYASGIFAATSRSYDQYASQSLARARIRRSAGSHHGPGLHLLRPLEHGPRPPSTPAPLPRIKDLASRLRSWSRRDYHPPAHAMGWGPGTSPPHEKVSSSASESDPDVLDPSYLPVAGQTQTRSTSTRRLSQGPVPSLPAARLLADGLTPTRVSHINSETVSRPTSLGLPTSVPVRHSTRLIHSHKPALHTTHPPTGPRAGPNVHISYQ